MKIGVSNLYSNYFIISKFKVAEVKLVDVEYQSNSEIFSFCNLHDNEIIKFHCFELENNIFDDKNLADEFLKGNIHKNYMDKIQSANTYAEFIEYIEKFIDNYVSPYAHESTIEELEDIFEELKSKS